MDLGLLAWTRNSGRLMDFGREFGTEPRALYFPRLRSRWLAPLRYLLSAAMTVAWLARHRPRVVMVTCPPPFAATLVAVYALLLRRAFILDAHPGCFGHRDRIWRLFVPLQKLLVRLAAVTMVTEPRLAGVVEGWGGRALVFHEAPPPAKPAPPRARPARRPKVVFTTIFDPDEPLDAIAAAACALRECDVAITGDYMRMAPEMRQKLIGQRHVQLTGWLGQPKYLELIGSADVVVALTLDPHSVMRSAFEAVYMQRATVLSDTETLRACFSPSVFVENSCTAVVHGVRGALAEYEAWSACAASRHDVLMQRWTAQRAALESSIAGADRRFAADVRTAT